MIQVTQTQEHGQTVYTFEANNTEYTVLSDDGQLFQVWSQRKSLMHPTVKVYTLDELAKRSKALNHLAQLIAA